MYVDELKKYHQKAIWFRRKVGGQVSLSKLGGLPNLPSGMQWPRQSRTGTPLHFLAQIDLSRLPPTPLSGASRDATLPTRGFLFFFADMIEEMLWFDNGGPLATTRVIYSNEAGPECSTPVDTPAIMHSFGELGGALERRLVKFPHAALEPHVIDTFGFLDPMPKPNTYTAAAMERITAAIEKAIGPLPVFATRWDAFNGKAPAVHIIESDSADGNGALKRRLCCPMHQMFGAGRNVQGAEENAQEDAVLLFQVDTDREIHKEFMFCDMGAAQFWIKVADLKAMRFDRAWGSTGGGCSHWV